MSVVAKSNYVDIVAPSRLHFGLLSFGHSVGRQYGGVGVMVKQPSLQIRISPATEFTVAGPLSERVIEFVDRWSQAECGGQLPCCRVEVKQAPRCHIGLGSGTQLAMSLACGLNRLLDRNDISPARLSRSVGRGRRSAIGTYGFIQGGLLAEMGKSEGDELSKLSHRIEMPSAWRFLLIMDRSKVGLSGNDEKKAFSSLPAVPRDLTRMLQQEIDERLVPAAETADFAQFSTSLFRYGHSAGMCFAPQQGGPYQGDQAAAIVAALQAMDVQGVGQSSWGPTLFALLPDSETAESIAAQLAHQFDRTRYEMIITAVSNTGARVEMISQG